MKRDVICCEKCVEFLAKRSTNLVRIWMELCAESIHNIHPLIFKPDESTTLKFLEQHGFVTTHDNKKNLLVRVNGLHHASIDDDDADFFCVKFEEHWEDEDDED